VSDSDIPVSPPRAWVEINTRNLRHNLDVAREISGCKLMAVVKAGAYGHGLEAISLVLEAADIAFLGVANIGEARRIRNAGVKTPIYLLGATWEQEREEIVARGITPCISSIAEAKSFDDIAKRHGIRLLVHLAVDTGMGRGGFLPSDLAEKITELKMFDCLEFEGIASHLSSSDEDEAFTLQQIASFNQIVQNLGGSEKFKWRHLSNSGGILGYTDHCCNLVRPGLMIYGISPIPGFQERLRTVMSLKSRVTLARTVPAGHSISYGRTYVTTQPTRIATIGIGYGDGYPRHLSGKNAEVWIRGQRHPIIGRVTMDQIIVRLPDDSNIECGDEVELFGANISANEVAQLADTIVWELFTGITPRVERLYIP
jgi:alanine racemase